MKSFLDWSAYENAGMGDAYADIPKSGGDFAKAVAVCIGSRQCETLNPKGVMCPSYRVSGDPAFSTGGRVRLLKAALNGELGDLPFTDPQLAEVMDDCVGCKGCKRECENSVDMATIKVEYLAQRQAQQGVRPRTRLFAGLPRHLYRHRRWLPRLLALRNRLPALARLGERLLGIRADRALPQPVAQPFPAEAYASAPVADAGREVVLFVDSFTRHFDPDIAVAARQVLEAAGYRVFIVAAAADDAEPQRPLCCGRTLIANGMIEAARAEARRVLAALEVHVAAGRWVLGLEPACLLALRDEYRILGLGEAAERLSALSILFEEFIAREHAARRLNLGWQSTDTPLRVLVHGHCHQKAVGAMKSMRKVMKLLPGVDFEFVEAACCGMAGGYGLEVEHAAAADAMAEQALLPALRAEPQARVLANGFSCREQIRLNDGRSAVHLAQLLRDRLTADIG